MQEIDGQAVGGEALFVQGVQKTGTSTLVGMLNCHPDIFVLYETNLCQTAISRYGNQLLKRYPGARQFFRPTNQPAVRYRELAAWLAQQPGNRQYRYFGDKLIDLDPDLTQRGEAVRTLFMLRDIRSWLVKQPVVRCYRSDLDVVPVTIAWLKYLIGSFRHRHCLRIWMEDLLNDNAGTLVRLSRWLGLDLTTACHGWWNRLGQHATGDPKSMLDWYSVHPSSGQPPGRLDTTVDVHDCPFWDEVLPLAERYRGLGDTCPSHQQISQDLATTETLQRYSPLPLEQCYRNVVTTRIGIDTPLQSDPQPARQRRGRRFVPFSRYRSRQRSG